MGIFNKLGKAFGGSGEINIEEYMNSEEMENVDVMHEPADFYVKPFALQQESDVRIVQEELHKKNIILLNISELNKRPNTQKTLIESLKEYIGKIDGDIARIDEDKIMLTPAKVKIIKGRRKPKK